MNFEMWYTVIRESKVARMDSAHSGPERLAQLGERRGPAGISSRKALCF